MWGLASVSQLAGVLFDVAINSTELESAFVKDAV